MKDRPVKIKVILEKMTLVLLFSAALNLSFYAALPRYGQELNTTSGSYLNEQTFFLLPFREKEFNQSSQIVCNSLSLSFTLNTQWSAITQNQIILGLFFKAGKQVHKDFPILQFVKNLRI